MATHVVGWATPFLWRCHSGARLLGLRVHCLCVGWDMQHGHLSRLASSQEGARLQVTELFPIGTYPDRDVAKPELDDIRLWSITTIIGVVKSPAIDYWSRQQVAKAAITIRSSLATRVEEDGEEVVEKFLIDAPFRKPKDQRSAAQLGTDFHAIGEEIGITGNVPYIDPDDELAPMVGQYLDWLDRAQPEFLAAEMPVYNLTYGYAGTADGIMKLQGIPLNFDYKSSRKSRDNRGNPTGPYPEVALQIAAARYAEHAVPVPPRRAEVFRRRYYLYGPGERQESRPVPNVDGGIVIHVTPEHCEGYVLRCDEPIFDAFLYRLEDARFEFETSKTVIGDILQFSPKVEVVEVIE